MVEKPIIQQTLILGCAQLGLAYGVANKTGKPDKALAAEIVAAALESGIDTFDTARAYGDSEAVLGEALSGIRGSGCAKVMTKLPPDIDPTDEDAILAALDESMDKLRTSRLYALSIHRFSWLERLDDGLRNILRDIRDSRKTETLGVSVYSPTEAACVLENDLFELIQAPCSAWDTRLLDTGIPEMAEEKHKKLHIRSVYLQGLLLMPPEDAARRIPAAAKATHAWNHLSSKLRMDKKTLAIGFVRAIGCPMVVGAETPEQVVETAQIAHSVELDTNTMREIRETMSSLMNEDIVNPARWGR